MKPVENRQSLLTKGHDFFHLSCTAKERVDQRSTVGVSQRSAFIETGTLGFLKRFPGNGVFSQPDLYYIYTFTI